MKKILDIITEYIKNNCIKGLIYGIATLIIIFSTIFLIYPIDKWDNKKNSDTINYNNNSNDNSNEPTVTPDLTEDNPSEIETPEFTDEIEVDVHEPQTQASTGVELDIKEIDTTGKNEVTMTFGIDVAKWQGVIDWEKVKDAGIEFAMMKVTAKEVTNLRLVPTTEIEDTVAAELNKGDIAIRTGIGDNGWSRLEYGGKVFFVSAAENL